MNEVATLIEMNRFVAASLVVGGKLHTSGKAMVRGEIGEFLPNDKEGLPESIENAVLKIAGYAPLPVFHVNQRKEVSGWRFRMSR